MTPCLDIEGRARAEQKKAWKLANPEKMRAYTRKSQRRLVLQGHGLTFQQYEAMVAAQDGVCAVCRLPETTVVNGRVIDLAIDHCHTTGVVRGLLCSGCNKALGCAGDDPARLRALAVYLEVSR